MFSRYDRIDPEPEWQNEARTKSSLVSCDDCGEVLGSVLLAYGDFKIACKECSNERQVQNAH